MADSINNRKKFLIYPTNPSIYTPVRELQKGIPPVSITIAAERGPYMYIEIPLNAKNIMNDKPRTIPIMLIVSISYISFSLNFIVLCLR